MSYSAVLAPPMSPRESYSKKIDRIPMLIYENYIKYNNFAYLTAK